MTTAAWRITGSVSGETTEHGHDAENGETLTLQVIDAGTDLRTMRWTQVAKSPDSPDLVFDPATGEASPPGGTVTCVMPSTGAHFWIVRGQKNGGRDHDNNIVSDWTVERAIAIRNGAGIRKMAASETTQYDPVHGWAECVNKVVDYAPNISLVTPATPGTVAALGPAGTLYKSDGVTDGGTWGKVVNADITGPIDGDKVNPAFGSQNVSFTGTMVATGDVTINGKLTQAGAEVKLEAADVVVGAVGGKAQVVGEVGFPGVMTFEIQGDLHNFDATGVKYIRFDNSGGSRELSGIAGGWPGRELTILFTGNGSLTLRNQDSMSDDENRFIFAGSNPTLEHHNTITLWYDGVDQRWRPKSTV